MELFKMFATLGMKSDEFNQGIDSAKEKAGTLGQTFGTVSKVALGAIGAMTAGILAFGKQSVDTGKEFDAAMSQVAATMGMTTEDIVELRDFAKEMGRSTQFSATQAADAMNILAMAGYDAEKSMESLPTILNLAAAGGLEIASAADYATGIMAGFGLETDQVGHVADALATIASSAKGDVASFGEGLSTVAGMARSTGQNLDDMTVALGILGNNNYSAAEAGNALSRTLRNLYQPTDSAATALEQLGVSAYTAEGEARPLQDVLKDLQGALGDMDDEAKNQALSQIFDAATLKTIPALLNNVGDGWDDLAQKIENSQGAAEQMRNTMEDNLQGDLTKLGSAVEGAKIAFSDQLTPALRDFTQYATNSVSVLTDAFSNGGLDGLFSALPDVLSEGIAKITTGIPKVIGIAKDIVSALMKGLYANAPLIAQGAVEIVSMLAQSMIESIPALMQAGTEMINSISEGLVEGIPAFLEQALPMLLSFTDSLRENFGTIVDAGIQFVLNLVDGIIEALPQLWEYVPQIVSNIAGLINDNAPKLLMAGVELITRLITGVVNSIPLILQNFGSIVKAVVDVFLAFNWLNLGSSIIDFIVDGVKSLFSALPDVIGNIGQNAWDALVTIDWLALGSDLINMIVSGVNVLFGSLGEILLEIGNDAWNALANIDWAGVGQDIIDGVVSGLSWAGNAIKNKLIGLGRDAWQGVKDFFGIQSPSKLMRDTVGKMIPLGLAEGIEAETDAVIDAMDRLGEVSMGSVDIGSVNGERASGYNQTVIINAPTELSPAEIARQTRNATRDMVLAINGV